MELSAIVYSSLAIVAFLIFVVLFISYLGYRMKQKEESTQNDTLFRYHNYEARSSDYQERIWR